MFPYPYQRHYNYFNQQSYLRPSLPPKNPSQFPVGSIIKGQLGSYEIIQEKDLGSGTYGSVKLVFESSKSQYFAMKIISKTKITQFKAEENIKLEIQLQKSLNNPHIVKIIEVIEDSQFFFIILECCRQGNLFEMIVKKKKLSEEESFQIFYQVCLGLKYLHENSIVHRDIKPENILICDDKSVKICDFNWAIKLSEGQKADPVICGTTEYMPPEVVQKQKHDFGVDIWSLGIVLYQMLHGELPFKGKDQDEKIKAILDYKLHVDSRVTANALLFIHLLLTRNLSQRPQIGQVFLNKWIVRWIKASNYNNPCPNKILRLDFSFNSLQSSNYFSNSSQRTTAISQQRSKRKTDYKSISSPYKYPPCDNKPQSYIKIVQCPAFARDEGQPFKTQANMSINNRIWKPQSKAISIYNKELQQLLS